MARYVVATAHQLDTVALWVAHTHAFAAAETTPYISVRSAEKRSGKTRLLEVVENLVPNPLKTENISVAALVHTVSAGATLLLDEVDSVFRRGKASETQDMLRGILDSGYRKSGSYVRMVGSGANMSPHKFNTFGPKMLSGIGKLPGTLDDRSIDHEMKRKTSSEQVARYRYRDAKEEAEPIHKDLAAWAVSAIPELRDARPDIPTALDDRAQDGWEPLLAIADLAGGDWPQRARGAAIALSAGEAKEDESLSVLLLTDIKALYRSVGADRLLTEEVLRALNGADESPWGGFHDGKGMNGRDLARMLKKYGVRPKDLRVKGTTKVRKGYERQDFIDAFSRYVDDPSATNATRGSDATEGPKPAATHTPSVADTHDPSSPVPSRVADVADDVDTQAEDDSLEW